MISTHLRSFHAVATHGGFTAASKVLNVGQPTLTTQVKALEARHGVELFRRAGRRVVLTEAGEDLYRLTLRMARLQEETQELLQSHKGLTTGRLRIAAVGPFHAIDMISAFKQAYPNVEVSVLLGNSRRTAERLLRYDADVGVTARVDADDRIEMEPYSTHSVVVFVNSEHRFFQRETISFRELRNERVVLREKGSTTRTAFEAALEQATITIDPVLEIGSREGVWKAVERGLGVGVVADFEFVRHPRLKTVAFADASIKTEYFLAYLRERQDSRLIRSFCKIALNENNIARGDLAESEG